MHAELPRHTPRYNTILLRQPLATITPHARRCPARCLKLAITHCRQRHSAVSKADTALIAATPIPIFFDGSTNLAFRGEFASREYRLYREHRRRVSCLRRRRDAMPHRQPGHLFSLERRAPSCAPLMTGATSTYSTPLHYSLRRASLSASASFQQPPLYRLAPDVTRQPRHADDKFHH